ncbi:Piso0_002873 [Millerozyma farinosa CBS 7064]|uniref:Piso0_002873 protein n=1 Tax=Pichia sorbitophila (strain ATCC MYA-4447 / BCRC 22081 / CBS 7064 / NBRC 10061 / NRRL Y-12695) TaxID=559304 RepID=G8YG75_PICSO|nr:Piso0_002873 [Millerozyma farinosa CBS 7064]
MPYTKSLNLIQPYIGEDGKKYVNIPKNSSPTTFASVTPDQIIVSDKEDVESIYFTMEKYGVCIVRNFLSSDTCDTILEELNPHFFREESWKGSPFPEQTTVVTRSVLYSPTSLNNIVANELFVKVASYFLSESNYFWIGKNLRTGNSTIQLNSGITYKVGPHAGDQLYHREDMVHHNIHTEKETFIHGDESMVGISVALTDTTQHNGATRALIGSHLWGPYDGYNESNSNCERYLEMEKGDCMFLLGSTYHAASANRTTEDRITSFYFMTKSYLKQEENLHLGTPLEFFKGLDQKTLTLLGLHTSEPFCGHIDYKSPMEIINPRNKEEYSTKENYSESIIVQSSE